MIESLHPVLQGGLIAIGPIGIVLWVWVAFTVGDSGLYGQFLFLLMMAAPVAGVAWYSGLWRDERIQIVMGFIAVFFVVAGGVAVLVSTVTPEDHGFKGVNR